MNQHNNTCISWNKKLFGLSVTIVFLFFCFSNIKAERIFYLEPQEENKKLTESNDSSADTTEVEEVDNIDEEENQAWFLYAEMQYEKAHTSKGLDLSGTNPTLSSYISIFNEKGWNGTIGYSHMMGTDGGPLSYTAKFGYRINFASWLGLNTSFAHYKYYDSSINAISSLENSLDVRLESDLSFINLALEFEYYFGSDPARFLSLEAIKTVKIGPLGVDFGAYLTLISQNIEQTLLEQIAVKLKKKKQTTTTTSTKNKTTISGISDFSLDAKINYEIGRGFTVYIDPTFMVTPKSEISSQSTQLSWQLGLNYELDF